ncbi:hypothetical protein PENSUB_3454 [Penicillium subrubescens]|uniref:Uncharacterized protein n=1 Tax=Penicillium subrubescens TaxID=1316194 RepID=A0A1Q5UF34_9EURO|nr:hypothetical protein PENSUB_3454 [Penicillium subrubescens]
MHILQYSGHKADRLGNHQKPLIAYDRSPQSRFMANEVETKNHGLGALTQWGQRVGVGSWVAQHHVGFRSRRDTCQSLMNWGILPSSPG